MNSYIVNALMSSAPYLVVAAFVLAVSFFVPATLASYGVQRRRVRVVAYFLIAFGLGAALFFPSNTPKNTLDVNIKKENRAITEQINSRVAKPVQNIAAQPKLTDEERAVKFDAAVDRSRFQGAQQ